MEGGSIQHNFADTAGPALHIVSLASANLTGVKVYNNSSNLDFIVSQ